MCSFECTMYILDEQKKSALLYYNIFLDSSMVEHTAVNRGVVGSSPTRGVMAPWSSG